MSNDQLIRPTLETLLERINTIGETITNDVAQLRADMNQRFEAVENEIAGLRKDVEKGFRRVERKIDLLNRDFLAMRGDQDDVLERIEALESKAS